MAMAIDNTPDRRFLIGPSLAYTGEQFFQIFADLEPRSTVSTRSLVGAGMS